MPHRANFFFRSYSFWHLCPMGLSYCTKSMLGCVTTRQNWSVRTPRFFRTSRVVPQPQLYVCARVRYASKPCCVLPQLSSFYSYIFNRTLQPLHSDLHTYKMPSPTLKDFLAQYELYADLDARVLICCRCQYALTLTNSQVSIHLQDKHNVASNLQQGLMQYLKGEHPSSFDNPANVALSIILCRSQAWDQVVDQSTTW